MNGEIKTPLHLALRTQVNGIANPETGRYACGLPGSCCAGIQVDGDAPFKTLLSDGTDKISYLLLDYCRDR